MKALEKLAEKYVPQYIQYSVVVLGEEDVSTMVLRSMRTHRNFNWNRHKGVLDWVKFKDFEFDDWRESLEEIGANNIILFTIGADSRRPWKPVYGEILDNLRRKGNDVIVVYEGLCHDEKELYWKRVFEKDGRLHDVTIYQEFRRRKRFLTIYSRLTNAQCLYLTEVCDRMRKRASIFRRMFSWYLFLAVIFVFVMLAQNIFVLQVHILKAIFIFFEEVFILLVLRLVIWGCEKPQRSSYY